MKSVILTIMFFTTVGCTRTIYTPQVRTQKVVDTLVQQVADSATIRALFECDSAGRVVLRELQETKGRMAAHEMSIVDGEVRVVTRWQTKYVDRVTELHDTTTVVEVREVVRVERHVPRFFWWCFAVAAGTGLWSLWRVARKFF